MSTATGSPAEIEAEVDIDPDPGPAVDMVVTFEVGPGGLDRFLELIGDRRRPLIRCLDGGLTLESPSRLHERRSRVLHTVVTTIAEELDIPFYVLGSTLLRPPGRKDSGIEPDDCYYFEHEEAVRRSGEQDHLDLSTVPPPDLVVETVVGHRPDKALAICAMLGVPEVWVHWPRRKRLEFRHLEGGVYVARDRSRSLPFLTPADVLPWPEPSRDEPDNHRKRRLRDWVRAELAPRRAAP